MEIPYHLLFPAKLRVVHNNKIYFFETPTAAWMWVTEEVPLSPHWGGSLRNREVLPKDSRLQQRERTAQLTLPEHPAITCSGETGTEPRTG
ncbi:hypothetical protein NDU88_004963 [Pleurodeles waltl]|uniref:Uncharacterized protein n=1 Tax=Pleurodeles waltl TaxID=8319 RepID=A0AAV7LQV4_PLEWA|nr:hypothetical protein NDU88_004963 [Pleurodeles waltl]